MLEPDDRRGIDLAMWLALAGPAAYLFAYRFNKGYLEFFGVPDTLVDVDVKDLLYMAGVLLSAGYTTYLMLDGFLVWLPDSWPNAIKRRALWLFLLGSAGVFLFRMERIGWLVWVIALCALLLLAYLLVVRPLRRKSNVSLDPPRPDPYTHRGIIPALIRAGAKREILLASLLVLVASQIMSSVGELAASWKSDYLVHRGDDGAICAVIRARDAEFLCANLESNTPKLSGTYRFLESAGVTLHRQAGRLERPDPPRA